MGLQIDPSIIDRLLERIQATVGVTVREEVRAAMAPGRAEWLTTQQAAVLLMICPTSLEKARSTGHGTLASIPYAKIGRSVRYARADILAAVARLRVPGRATKA